MIAFSIFSERSRPGPCSSGLRHRRCVVYRRNSVTPPPHCTDFVSTDQAVPPDAVRHRGSGHRRPERGPICPCFAADPAPMVTIIELLSCRAQLILCLGQWWCWKAGSRARGSLGIATWRTVTCRTYSSHDESRADVLMIACNVLCQRTSVPIGRGFWRRWRSCDRRRRTHRLSSPSPRLLTVQSSAQAKRSTSPSHLRRILHLQRSYSLAATHSVISPRRCLRIFP